VTDAANEEAWISLVKELDENGDGKISFAEFKQTLVQFSEDNDEKEC
jgi:Ca2+-binding EF-hand superfamily protein